MTIRHTKEFVKYKGTELVKGQQKLDQDKGLDILEWPLEKAIEEIKNGTIRDAKTIIGLQMVRLG